MSHLHETGCDNMNFQVIILALLAIFGYNTKQQPVRLHKKVTLREKINNWVAIHKYELLLLLTILVMFLVVFVLFLLIGSATDSGNVYNHIEDVI